MVVAGDDSLGTVEERRIDMSADACRREQEGLFLFHLGYQFWLEPSVQCIGETLVAANYRPLRLASVVTPQKSRLVVLLSPETDFAAVLFLPADDFSPFNI